MEHSQNCRVVTTPLSDNEKKVMLLSANLQVRGGFANEMIRRKAVAELVSCLQAEPYNLTAAEAKKGHQGGNAHQRAADR